MKKKLLVYNIMEFPEKIKFFNRGISEVVKEVGINTNYYVFGSDLLPVDRNNYSHLIISGSEASAMDESPWTEELTTLILDFVQADKKILAICYGHQFLVRALLGKEHVYKMPVPEYGYAKINLSENRLFRGINDPVVLELHYDAVRNLSPDFEIIAENETSIQAFQYQDKNVFGVQFHPEFDQSAARYFLDETAKCDPAFPSFYKNELDNDARLEQNSLFIRNFLQ